MSYNNIILKVHTLCFSVLLWRFVLLLVRVKKVFVGADHGGFLLKKKILLWLEELGYDYEDLGPSTYDKTDDYPDYAKAVLAKVVQNKAFGILLCRTGVGVNIMANKTKGVFSVLAFNQKVTQLAREHENVNVLSLPAEFLTVKTAKAIVHAFLTTPFSHAPRHLRRITKLTHHATSFRL